MTPRSINLAWENELPPSSSQASVPRTPSSSQAYSQSSSQARMSMNASSITSTPLTTSWTNQNPLIPPLSSTPSKRKRSPSPSSVPRTPASLPASGSGVLSDERRALIYAGLSTPSAGGDSRAHGSPAKRAKLDDSSDLFSGDESLWGTDTDSIFRAGLDKEMLISSAQKPSTSGNKFNEDEEDQELLGGGVARKLDFTRMRAGTATGGPAPEDDPVSRICLPQDGGVSF